MRVRYLLVVLAITLPTICAAGDVDDSIVRVSATLRLPNPIRPWTKQNPVEVGGTGVVIAGNKILTNAHVVLYAAEVTVQGRDGGDRVEAKVESIAPGIDLAVLSLDDPDFFTDRPPIARSEKLPPINSAVTVKGFPVGGREISTTQGVISRIEFSLYDPMTFGRRIQVDAAVNPGNSGGPALVGGKMIGLAFGRLAEAENVGYIIPNDEIDVFLSDVADGIYQGKPSYTGSFQSLENEALRAKLGLDKSVRGVMVRRPGDIVTEATPREFDVLVKVGEKPIDNEGLIRSADGRREPMFAEFLRLIRDGKVGGTVLRQGKEVAVYLPMDTVDRRLVRPYAGLPQSFFVHGPLVFAPVTEDALPMYFRMNPILSLRGGPLLTRRRETVKFPGEELVIITTPIFKHKVAKGYDEPFGLLVDEFNGVKVKNLGHLVELLGSNREEFATFRLAGEGTEILVFRSKALDAATDEVMSENGISRRGSDDVMAIWNRRIQGAK